MKVVVDEGVPKQLVHALRQEGLDAFRFKKQWEGASNGELIRAIEAESFAVLVTNDKNMADQQSLRGRNVAVVALPLNRRRSIMERVSDIADTIRRSGPGQHIVMEMDGRRTVRIVVDGLTVVDDLPRIPAFGV